MMNRELEIGMRVRLLRPELGYRYGELVDFFWPRWVVRLSSGYEFSVYEDEFEVDD